MATTIFFEEISGQFFQEFHYLNIPIVRIASTIFTDTDKWYKDTEQQLKNSLKRFNDSLQGGEFVIISGMNLLVSRYLL